LLGFVMIACSGIVLFQSDNGGYYGHGTHGKTRKETIPVLITFFSFRGFCGY
jgi:hypothetical protein